MGRKPSPNTTPQAVSARLKRSGFTTVATRNLEGIRVSRGILGSVSIDVDLDVPRQEERLANLVAEELAKWDGFEVWRASNHFYVRKSS